ncbi:hypothetical protein ACTFR8_22385 [Bacillus cereus group sp. MYBK15-3]|uniref:hypothetical protein n=1 Tax=Bacillus cereus group TaxID=86661 RepID=UPI001C8CC09A|nr:hypothetical protein [Bacillus cereus]MBX9158350.1 hypothetical protein [Bacillus cereus]
MIHFVNRETTLANKRYEDTIQAVVEENQGMSFEELHCLVSETIEDKIKEELAPITEGFVAEYVWGGFEEIDYRELTLRFFAKEWGKIQLRCIYDGGEVITTTFKGTYNDAVDYYIGNVFNVGTVTDDMQTCTKIEVLG